MTIDIKSLAAGLVLGISIAYSFAAKAPGGAVGRYQMHSTATPGSYQYVVIDTQTGKVWKNRSAQ
ncbi:hypothetical protein N8586_02010 [Verrucomicrobiales bacterium]|nr:hypothetical protein [Verrucomicrobiales bacterium]